MNLLLAISLFARLALATDTWSDPAPGIRLLRRTTSDPNRISAIEVDLCARGVSLRATGVDERQRTVSSFGGLVDAQAAINGDFFSYEDYYPSGLAIGAGSLWNADTSSESFVAFGRDHAGIGGSDPAAWVAQAVGGRPVLVEGGAAGSGFTDPSHCSSLNPRTAVGLSEDRQTLWLAVVDGRSTSSEGMTCDQLATLMQGLGAYTAMNLDGGGSSALWVDGEGVINDPSDGSERVVSNHLAVLASGTGAAESCDFWRDEVLIQADAPDVTDVDGDGTADTCARAAASFRCHVASGEAWTIEDLGNDAAFGVDYATIRMADVTGDGLADVCARGVDGFGCWPSTGTAFGARIDGPGLSDATGWSDVAYASTLRLADVDGDGMADLCARAAAGIRCYRSTGLGFEAATVGPTLSDDSGWGTPDHYGTIRLGDIDADGRADLCARAGAGMWCWRADGTRVDGPAWSDAAGWGEVAYWSTIRLDDIDGDGRADLCGRGPDGFECYRGDAFTERLAGPALSDASGWDDHANYETIRLGDVDGDGDRDVCARANAAVYCWLYDAGAFTTRIDGPALSDDDGWDDPRSYTTLRLGDIDADGDADLCGRSSAGFFCWRSEAGAFSEAVAGPEWSDASGWAGISYYSTIRLGGGGAPPVPDPEDTGADTGEPAPAPARAEVVSKADGCGCGTTAGSGWWIAGIFLALARASRPGTDPGRAAVGGGPRRQRTDAASAGDGQSLT